MKIFIDCGGHCGCSARKFRAEFDPEEEFHICSFEAFSKYGDFYKDISKKTLSNNTLCNKGVWVEDKNITFYFDESDGQGSTIFSNKITGNLKTSQSIPCIDLSQWILETFDKNDTIYLKLNVEGAEYAILEKMLQDNTIDLIDRLFVCWHQHKIPSIPIEAHNDLIQKLKDRNIKVEEWKQAWKYCI